MSRARACGFSLIEVLIVIAVITTLATLLIPVLGVVREQARETQCGSRQRQLGTAILNYRSDWKGAFPNRQQIVNTADGIYDTYFDQKDLTYRLKCLSLWALGERFPAALSPRHGLSYDCSKAIPQIDGSADTRDRAWIDGAAYGQNAKPFPLLFCGSASYTLRGQGVAGDGDLYCGPQYPHQAKAGAYTVSIYSGVLIWLNGRCNVFFTDGHVQPMKYGGNTIARYDEQKVIKVLSGTAYGWIKNNSIAPGNPLYAASVDIRTKFLNFWDP